MAELVDLVPEEKQQKAKILLQNVVDARKISKLGNVFAFMKSMSDSNRVSDVTNLIPKEQKAPPPRVKHEAMVSFVKHRACSKLEKLRIAITKVP